MKTGQTVNPLLPPPMGVTGNCGGGSTQEYGAKGVCNVATGLGKLLTCIETFYRLELRENYPFLV